MIPFFIQAEYTCRLSPPWDDVTDVSEIDVQFFFSNIYSQFQGAVQYSGDNSGSYAFGHGIPDMCAFMTDNSSDPLHNIAAFNEYMTIFYQGGGVFNSTENSYADFIQYLRTAQQYGPDAAASTLWTWQTCTEFGYFQSSDSSYSIFGSPTPVNMFTKMCTDVFGGQFTAAAIQQSITRTNLRYGGRDRYKGTNVAIPNGSIDPWHALGKYTNNDPSVFWYLINGTAHCADMYPARPEDVPDLANARRLIESNLAMWISEAPRTSSPPATTWHPTVPTVPPVVSTAAPYEPSTPQGGNHAPSNIIVSVLCWAIIKTFLL
ncbi:serine carboxypeptidase S28 [Cooperia oncophora]